jgi:starch phosphorylase
VGGRPTDFAIWKRVEHIPDGELWRTHERGRERLVALARTRLKAQLKRRGSPPSEVDAADEVLDPDALTIGFARRFATYKRGDLVFRNAERLASLVNDKDRPVQLIFAGKAHPADRGGKELIQRVVQQSRRPEFRKRVVFVEDYDMNVARHLVQGVDVWLNNPRRPLEASGTSGMKAAMNGVPNLSILDGWWPEGCEHGVTGWKIGDPDPNDDPFDEKDEHRVDKRDRDILHHVLETEVLPAYRDRAAWVSIMRASIAMAQWRFSSDRMIEDYVTNVYSAR